MTTFDEQRQEAILRAKELYRQFQSEGVDLNNGPCIAEEIIPDWCADIAHSPRQSIDNEPQNQCRSFREGRVHHFVELDPHGNLIQAK